MKTDVKVRITRHTVADCKPVQAGDVVRLPAREALALLEMNAAELMDPADKPGLIAAVRADVAQRRLPAQWSPLY